MNEYDLYVANTMVEGKQCTICWYVDDIKVRHVDSKVVDLEIFDTEKKFGKRTVKRGKMS